MHLFRLPKFLLNHTCHIRREQLNPLFWENVDLSFNSGIERSSIRLHGNTLYVNKKKYGYANESIFNLCQPNNINSIIDQQDTQPEQPSPTLTLSSPNVEEESQSWLHCSNSIANHQINGNNTSNIVVNSLRPIKSSLKQQKPCTKVLRLVIKSPI